MHIDQKEHSRDCLHVYFWLYLDITKTLPSVTMWSDIEVILIVYLKWPQIATPFN